MKTNFTPDNSGLQEVTAGEWADHVSDFRTYQTESIFSNYSIMYSRLSPSGGYAKPGYVVGEIHYSVTGKKAYFIRG